MDEHRVGYTILIADDDANVHQSLNAYFKREGYQIISAYDGSNKPRTLIMSRQTFNEMLENEENQ